MSLPVFQPNFAVPSDQFLTMGVVLDATLTTAQNIAVLVPNPATSTQAFSNTTFVVSALKFRSASTAINAATTFSVGWTSTSGTTTATNVVSASTAVESQATGKVVSVATSPVTPGTPGQFLNITFAGTLTSNGTVVVDVLGYFTPAA